MACASAGVVVNTAICVMSTISHNGCELVQQWLRVRSHGWVSRSQIVSQNLRSICDKHTIKLRLEKRVLYNTNFSRGGNVRYIRELVFCAKFSSRENNIHCEWNFAKFSSREIFLPRNFPPRENKSLIAV